MLAGRVMDRNMGKAPLRVKPGIAKLGAPMLSHEYTIEFWLSILFVRSARPGTRQPRAGPGRHRRPAANCCIAATPGGWPAEVPLEPILASVPAISRTMLPWCLQVIPSP